MQKALLQPSGSLLSNAHEGVRSQVHQCVHSAHWIDHIYLLFIYVASSTTVDVTRDSGSTRFELYLENVHRLLG